MLPPRGKELAGCSYLYSSLLYLPLYVLHTCILLPRPALPPVPEPTNFWFLISVWLSHGYRVPSLGLVAREAAPAVLSPSFSCPPFGGGTSMDAIAQSGEGHPRCRRRRKRIGLRSILAGASVLLLVDINPTSNPRMTKLVIPLGAPAVPGRGTQTYWNVLTLYGTCATEASN